MGARGVGKGGRRRRCVALSAVLATVAAVMAVSPGTATAASEYSEMVVGDQPLAYWRLGEPAGTTAVDVPGGHDATYAGSPSLGAAGLIAGDTDTAVRFDGVDDVVAVPDAADINTGGPYTQRTVELWFDASQVASRQVLLEEGGANRGLNLYLYAGRLYFGGWNLFSDGGQAPWQAFVSTPVAAGQTYHAVLVFDATTDSLQGFLNGTSVGTTSGVGRLFAHADDVGIGAVRDGTYFHDGPSSARSSFAGTLDDVALYPAALAPDRIHAHHQAGSHRPYAATVTDDRPLALWRLGEPAGATAVDNADGHHGSYQGSPSLGTPGLLAGDPDTAVAFDGIDDVVAVPNAGDINTSGPYAQRTVELWFNALEPGLAEDVLDPAVGLLVPAKQVLFEEGGANRGLNLYLDSGRLYFGGWNLFADEGQPPWQAFLSASVAAGQTYHAVLVFDATRGSLQGFLNGTSVGTTFGVGRLFAHGGAIALGAVRGLGGSSTYFHDGATGEVGTGFAGTLDEGALYPAALAPYQIRAHYERGTTVPDPQNAGDADSRGGQSITIPDLSGDVGKFTSLVLDAAGNPVVSYYDAGGGDLRVLHCNDRNCTGGGESITSPDFAGDVGWFTSLVLDATGSPVVSYFDVGRGDLKVLHCNDPNCAGGDDSVTRFSSFVLDGWFTSLVLDAAGNPVVSYYDAGNDALRLLHCNDPNCTGGDESITRPDILAVAGDVGWYSSLVLDAAGSPVVSYWDRTNENLRLLHCNDPNCAGGDESVTSPDSAGRVGEYTSLVLDALGNPVISYYDATNGDVKVLHCNDPACTGGDESRTRPESSHGWEASLVLDAAGNPVVGYYAASRGFLRVLHCNDSNCAGGGESITRPDTTGWVGGYPSLVLDAAGNPVVSYYDYDNRTLKVLHCGNPACAP